nr:immunoglobulin light chain junction region [Macaca mulatta]
GYYCLILHSNSWIF